jgi:DNA (cytosine-5)-methyltransferase 1
MNYYNEHDKKTAAWLRELIKQRLIPHGVVDERSITDVRPSDLAGYTQCHFFAGIGGWSLALQLAGWPSDRPVWTGSCPCQPFSTAGKGLAQADERHLWPAFFNLIKECRPEHVFGEQVASAIGKGWLDGISADLGEEGYACGSAVLGAHSVGSPHIRQRLYWVADSNGIRSLDGINREEGQGPEAITKHCSSVWSDFTLVACRDGKTRRVPTEPAFFPLAHGIPARVVRLRGYGNAIVPQIAAEFAKACCDLQRSAVLGMSFNEEDFWG